MPRNDTKALRRAAQMPPLPHTLPDGTFQSDKSQVLDWLCAQADLRDALFTYCKHHGAIVYDKASGTWRGKAHGTGE